MNSNDGNKSFKSGSEYSRHSYSRPQPLWHKSTPNPIPRGWGKGKFKPLNFLGLAGADSPSWFKQIVGKYLDVGYRKQHQHCGR